MNDCIFCKIIKGEIPCFKIFEDDHAFAFLDINPIERGHTLVIPKFHAKELFFLPPEELAGVMPAIQRTATLLKKKLGCDGLALSQLNGEAAGQTVFHVHFHLIPRYAGTPIDWTPKTPAPTMDELAALHRQILG
ncbi:MAG: HIT family protein [Kiritimatiellae bacterium]|jgi:histidine triad (HIT) family protein|nr:HIT family protein [Kiritimatiellia bacterium]